jgi:hypothetical protein
VRRVLPSSFLAPPTTKRRKQSNPLKLTTHPTQSLPSTTREKWGKEPLSRERKVLFVCFMAMPVTWMSFVSDVRELRRGILIMLETHIMMSSLIFRLDLILMFHLVLILVLHLALLLVLCLVSLKDITIAHMVLVHERTTLSLDTLVMAHILIVVIISRVGLVFLLQGLTLALSRDTWTVHVFPIVVHIPLGQMVKCKGLCRLLLVMWLSARFLRFISLTPTLSHRPFLVICRCWLEDWRTCG